MGGEILKIAGVALIAVSAALILKAYRPELALQVSIGAGIVILAYALSMAYSAGEAVKGFAVKYGIDAQNIKTVIKIIGVAYIAQFAADSCRDCGESAVASKVELAGRLMMITAALPLLLSTITAIGELMGA